MREAVALVSPPATLNAGTDTALTFVQSISDGVVQNNSAAAIGVEYDAVATAGSLQLAAGALLQIEEKVTVLHLLAATALTLNGTAPGGVVVKGFA